MKETILTISEENDESYQPGLLARQALESRIDLASRSDRVQTLRILATDNHSAVRLALLDNPSLPEEIFFLLCEDENADIRYATAEDYRSPFAVLSILITDENPYVAQRAEQTVNRLFQFLAAA